jgi:hypothetical protein
LSKDRNERRDVGTVSIFGKNGVTDGKIRMRE